MDAQIQNGIDKLKATFSDAKFIVFGSQASGRQGQNSDLDLCAVFPVLDEDLS